MQRNLDSYMLLTILYKSLFLDVWQGPNYPCVN